MPHLKIRLISPFKAISLPPELSETGRHEKQERTIDQVWCVDKTQA